jgi:WD40 repeat protein
MEQPAEQTGPVRAPSPSQAVEAPRPPRRDLTRVLGGAVAGIAVLGIAIALIVRNVRDGSAADAAPAPALTAPETVTPAAPPIVLVGNAGPARAVAISPSGDRVLAVRDRGVDVWTLDGARIAWLGVDGDRVDGAAWSIDGTRVVLWGPDGTVRLWNASTGAMVQTVQAGMGVVAAVELDADNRATVIGTNGVRRIWNLGAGTVTVERSTAAAGVPAMTRDATSLDGKWRAHIDGGGRVELERIAI